MRVIDHRRAMRQAQKRSVKKPVLILVMAAIIVGGVIAISRPKADPVPAKKAEAPVVASAQPITTKVKKGVLKQFTGQEFKDLYDKFTYPNTRLISEDTPITGNDQADQHIRQVAIARGYKIRSAPVSDTFKPVGDGFALQQRAAQPWLELKAAAKKDGINLNLTAGYRSAADQKQIFLGRLKQLNLTPAEVATGEHGAQVSQVLRSTALPGYSRHHTGYTVDIGCVNEPAASFEFTACFRWLNAKNYEHAKTNGWIPSYPQGTDNQGPDPEPWEYVWVGKDAVTE